MINREEIVQNCTHTLTFLCSFFTLLNLYHNHFLTLSNQQWWILQLAVASLSLSLSTLSMHNFQSLHSFTRLIGL